MSRQPSRYVGRYILADGRPRAFPVYAWTHAEAAAKVDRAAREELGEAAYRAARCWGVEKA